MSASALNAEKFSNFKLAKITKYNHNCSIFTFSIPEGTKVELPTCATLVVKAADETKALNAEGQPKITPYTPINLNDTSKIDFLIKLYPQGITSSHIHGLSVGDELAIKGPNPKFPYKANEFKEVGLIAGGAGLTPIWQLLNAIDTNPEDKTIAHFIFGNIAEEDILLREELDRLAKTKPDQFKIHYILDNPPAGWTGHQGYITKDVLAGVLPSKNLGDQVKVFVCGPPGQMKAISGPKKSMTDQGPVEGALSELGYVASQVYKF
ncbi:hypothetical protein MNV49_003114 [Pseudohyphozyma bogoriensis]|nr:hypothetical protein MNV49_003114 [Pseudohyphozyma bogoriensis]